MNDSSSIEETFRHDSIGILNHSFLRFLEIFPMYFKKSVRSEHRTVWIWILN